MYRVGFPGWKVAGRLGVPLLLRLKVLHDKEASVLVITSPDLAGLVVEVPEGAAFEAIQKEIHACVDMLMADLLKAASPRTMTAWPGEFQPA